MERKVFMGIFTQYGRRVSRVRVRVSVKTRVKFVGTAVDYWALMLINGAQ